MAKIYNNFENLSKKKQKMAVLFLILFISVLIVGIKSTFAYYEDNDNSVAVLAATIGDFDVSGDINIVINKETAKSTGNYVVTYGVPSIGYHFNEGKTSCINPRTRQPIECSKDGSNDCHYTFSTETREFSLTSKQRVTCNFYFDMDNASDVDVLVYIENDEVGDRSYNSKNYQFVNDIPTEGYSYQGYNCDNSIGSVSYDSNTRKFTVTSTKKTRCYAYFDKAS